MKAILVAWVVLVLVYITLVFAITEENDAILASYEIALFILLGVQLITVNCVLLKQLNTLFPSSVQSNFRREKFFLMSTLAFFTFSYFVMVLRNILIFSMITGGVGAEDKVGLWLCKTNFRMALFNAICDIFTELTPYCIIFVLNFNNFREIEKHEQIILQQYQALPIQHTEEIDTPDPGSNADGRTMRSESSSGTTIVPVQFAYRPTLKSATSFIKQEQ